MSEVKKSDSSERIGPLVVKGKKSLRLNPNGFIRVERFSKISQGECFLTESTANVLVRTTIVNLENKNDNCPSLTIFADRLLSKKHTVDFLGHQNVSTVRKTGILTVTPCFLTRTPAFETILRPEFPVKHYELVTVVLEGF